MTEYVLCYVRDLADILVIDRKKKDWQEGKLNMPGGRIEEGETAEQAAIREIKEESNIDATSASLIGSMHCHECIIYVMACGFDPDDTNVKSSAEGDVNWINYPDLLCNPRLIPNLRVIIPLALAGVQGWQLYSGETDCCMTLNVKGCLDV